MNKLCTMKKATPKSIATWAIGAGAIVGYQFARTRYPAIGLVERLGIFFVIGVLTLSLNLMDDAPPQALLPSKLNSPTRNVWNIANIVGGIVGSASFFCLSGLFGIPAVGSPMFWTAIAGLSGCILVQTAFAIATANATAT